MGQHHIAQKPSKFTAIMAFAASCFVFTASAQESTSASSSSVPSDPAVATAASIWDGWDEIEETDDDATDSTSDGSWWSEEGDTTDGESDGGWWGEETDGTTEPDDGEWEEWQETDGEWTDGEATDGDATDSEWSQEPIETEADLSEPTGDEPLGYICYRDGREKPITPIDALWLAKMVDGETGGDPSQADADAMLWTIVQRTDLPSFRDKSVEYLTRRYSQPINQRWTRSGDKCRQYYQDGFSGTIPDKCSRSRTRRRAENIAKAWDDTAELARRATLDFATGRITNPVIGSIGWFDSAVWRRGETNGNNDNRSLVAEIERNTFYARKRGPATVDWDQWDVSVVPADQFCPDFVGSDSIESVEEVSE